MRFNEILSELFDPNKAVPFKWVHAQQARAQLPDGRYLTVNFHPSSKTEWSKHPFSIEFSVNDEFDMTGRGGANTIFATVIEIVKNFIQKQTTLVALYFTAEEKSRARMYDTLAKRIAKQVGWHVVPHDEMVDDPKYATPLSYGDFLFALEPGTAPEHRQDAQQPQHGEFMPIYYVYSLENKELAAIKIKAPKAHKAEEWVIKNVPEYKNEHPMAVMAYKHKPKDKKIIDMGQVPKPEPKTPPRELSPLEKKLHDKINGVTANENFADGKNPGRKGLS